MAEFTITRNVTRNPYAAQPYTAYIVQADDTVAPVTVLYPIRPRYNTESRTYETTGYWVRDAAGNESFWTVAAVFATAADAANRVR